MTTAQTWRTTLRAALLTARKDRDPVRVAALRSALAAIDNAETPDDARTDAPASATIAGGVAGLGAAEVDRRELSDAQIRALLTAEIDERRSAAAQVAAGGHPDRAATLDAEAAVLAGLMGDV
ncbi:hypothetical protein SAMN04489835_5204 [Mycolicibacterium rutilum]|uniref:GatB/YqeY n=1 Tax=Mycolicibacterium rutilum TaxID=370526 RepID=A0A1H6LNM9_MYCRU|nr:GatB/YqeY domain-containing protein [Mycolicibacterium rutilum]SEH87906.1 hypothetical protein SAMN04489835_5204 [Mycolicibacterium rutilum]